MRIASALALVVSGLLAVTTGAQTPTPQTAAPQTYILSAEIAQYGEKVLVAIYRDGAKERVEMAPPGLSPRAPVGGETVHGGRAPGRTVRPAGGLPGGGRGDG